MSLPLTNDSASRKSTQSPRHHSTRNPSPTSVPILTKKTSLQNNTALNIANRELVFRQLTEQLWAAGLPSSTTGCSMSICSRCSSAPPSECGGREDETTKTDWNNDGHAAEANIDWDEPDKPDEDFGRYVPQTESSVDESNPINERTQTQQKSAINNIPSLMSLSITPPPPIMTTNTEQKSTIPQSVIKENIEPLPFPQHGPGPIQRPNKLSCASTTQSSSFLHDPIQTPDTPDVLIQINHLVGHQNSITTTPSNVFNVTNSSTIINDISTPNVSWTPFSPPEWSSKYDSTWPITNIQSRNISLPTQTQNPFAQRPISKEESTLWSSNLETTGTINTPLLKFSPAWDSSPSNRQENEINNPFWNPINLHETQPNSSAPWWPKTPSDENNNDNDKSRWDFAH